MQRDDSTNTKIMNTSTTMNTQNTTVATIAKIGTASLLAVSLGLTGCQTIKKITNKSEQAVATANQTAAQYYQNALDALQKEHYSEADKYLTELRTFYPTSPYAEQALLDLMYAQFQRKEYTLATSSAEQFIRLYPNNPQLDYAYYVRGVANMQSGSSALLNTARQQQAHRDTSYMRLAFNNFQELISRFPNSAYTPDAAQRMIYIYNQLAESELDAARWYIEREAYVAAANRAKWVFQYYPLSEQTPEAIAILAYSNDKLGLNDLATDYKTLLQINYPQWLTANGNVRLHNKKSGSWLNRLTFGRLGRSGENSSAVTPTQYTGATKTQVIERSAQLQLPTDSQADSQTQNNAPTTASPRRLRFGFGLPENDSEQINSQGSANQMATDSIVMPDNINPSRRTTQPAQRDINLPQRQEQTPSTTVQPIQPIQPNPNNNQPQ